MPAFDPTIIILIVLVVVLGFLMFRNSRKRRTEQEQLRTKMVPGAEVMTNFGLFGTLLSIDEESNIAEVETSPGTVLRVHRQTLARVVEPTEAQPTTTPEDDAAEPLGEPEFGERTTTDATDPVEPEAPAEPADEAPKPAARRRTTRKPEGES